MNISCRVPPAHTLFLILLAGGAGFQGQSAAAALQAPANPPIVLTNVRIIDGTGAPATTNTEAEREVLHPAAYQRYLDLQASGQQRLGQRRSEGSRAKPGIAVAFVRAGAPFRRRSARGECRPVADSGD